MQDVKPWYLSKTVLVNILMGIALIVGVFLPSVGNFIKEYFAEAGTAWAFINIILRAISKDKLSIN